MTGARTRNKMMIAPAMALVMLSATGSLASTEHEVRMLNNGATGRFVFEPAFLRIERGDSVRFYPTDRNHNSQSIKGMTPDDGSMWRGSMGQEVLVRFDVEGIYGYKCAAHYTMGMVGIIQVGENDDNLDEIRAASNPVKADRAFDELIAELP